MENGLNILIKNAKVIDPNSPHNGKTVDVLVENGIIKKIGTGLKADASTQIFEKENLHISPGFFDPTVHFCDPGEEHKEDLYSGLKAAKKGGYTAVGVLGITHPTVTEKTRVEYLINKAKGSGVRVYPIGCLSAKNEGKELAELYDMHKAGAIGFYDGKHAVNSGLLNRALAYTKDMPVTILSYPDEKNLSNGGLMHEGFEHIKLGLKGIPSLAEELGILRDIHLAEYNEAHVHIANVSTAKGVELIKNAKAKGIKVTAQCSIHHLFFNDEDMHGFDSNLKLLPPLRSKKDQDALIEGLKTGIIDTVTSDHIPQDIEAKKMEFDLAEFGTAGIETCFNALLTIAGKKLGLEKIVELLAINSRKSFGLNSPSIAENQEFEAALYNPDGSYTHGNATKVTKAYNDPYVGKTLQGEIFQIN